MKKLFKYLREKMSPKAKKQAEFFVLDQVLFFGSDDWYEVVSVTDKINFDAEYKQHVIDLLIKSDIPTGILQKAVEERIIAFDRAMETYYSIKRPKLDKSEARKLPRL